MSDVSDTCRVCGEKVKLLWPGQLLDLTVHYFECDACRYVQTERPYWLDRAYSDAINGSDTGIMTRNLANARIVMATLVCLGTLDGKVVDWAGGYGILVRLLRDYGIDALWADRYCKNLVARGFEYRSGGGAIVTAFEAFEHFLNPAEEVNTLLSIAPNILLSTEIIPEPAPPQSDWWYYGREHGQHIGFFRLKTLELLAARRGKHFLSNGHSYHLISDRPINKMSWLLLLAAKNLLPAILRPRLRSKTWQDHVHISGRDQ